MNRIFRFVALLLLAVWLPVTKHCMLEAAGMFDVAASEESSSGCCVDSEPCVDDNCEVVEQGLTARANTSPKVSSAPLLACVSFLSIPLNADRTITEPLPELRDAWDRPLGWVPAWNFERRTAQPPRAPSSTTA